MFDTQILEFMGDGNEYTESAIADALHVPAFLIQTTLQKLAGASNKISCRAVGDERLYSVRDIGSRLPVLDKHVDDMQAQQLPGRRPDDLTAIIKPIDDPIGGPVVTGTPVWSIDLPEGVQDLAPWVRASLGWPADPFLREKHTADWRGAVDSAIRWMGGKSKMLEWLVQRFPPHHTYVEVFGGSLKPFFTKEISKVEIVNDFYGDLINFWRVLSMWPDLLADEINRIPASRLYQRYFARAVTDHRIDAFDRAVMFGYLSLTSYNGLIWKPFAGSSHAPLGKADKAKFVACADRLTDTQIECMDFREILERYSIKKVAAGPVFTYMDPPYMQTEGYAMRFPDEWHQEIADWMLRIHESGNLVLLTNSEVAGEAYMRWFGSKRSEFTLQYTEVDYTIGHSDSRGSRREAVISNFRPEQRQGRLF